MKVILVYAFSPNAPQIQSPYCITKNLHRFLNSRCELQYYMWDQKLELKPDPEAIFVGHPHYDRQTIVQKVFRQNIQFKARCTIHPFHTAIPAHNAPFHDLARKADKIFSICGPYWYDTADQTEFAFWKPKMVRLDMAIDSKIWPYRKAKFNEPGNRGIVYVGSDMPMKNVGYLAQIAQKLPNVPFRWYGGSAKHPINRLHNVSVKGWCDFANKVLVQEICDFADFFLNVSTSDANPTTLLEFGLASGLIPICTQTSGYWKDKCFVNIPHNLDQAVGIIQEWLKKPSVVLQTHSSENRQICEEKYTWGRFCTTVWNEIKKLS